MTTIHDPVAAVEEAYRRLAGGQEAAWISVVPEAVALARARELLDEGRRDRPLWGVPFAVKDNIDVAGMVTTAGCPAYASTAERTAPAAQRLLDAGAVLIGKTNLDQFATGLVGTRSPYGTCHSVLDPALISGGSSSGSAVVVAEGVVPFALGTDTAGSGRVPAAANGIVGLKPTRGLVSTVGVVPACHSIDCVSVFATTVADASLVLDVLTDAPAVLPEAGGPRGRWRVGVPSHVSWGLAEGQAEAFAEAVADLAEWVEVVEVDLGPLLAAGELLYEGAFVAERLLTVGPLLASEPEALHPVVRKVVGRGLERTAAELFADQQRLRELAAELAPMWDVVDALACPTVPDLPTIEAVLDDPVGANAALGRWTHGVNLLDLCALTIPVGRRHDGLPGSLSLVGPAGADHRLAAIAQRQQKQVQTQTQVKGQVQEREVQLAVVGAHLRGLPLHHQLTDRGARFVRACRTAPAYRLHVLATDPPKPGMVRVGDDGQAIEAEVWALDVAAFGDFVAEVPPPLSIGTVDLEDGTQVKGFLCEPVALDGTRDITATGSWRVWWEAETNRSATDGRPVLPPGTTGRRKARSSAFPTSCPPPPAEADLGG
jgi:allophanate hydrolase